ncbi:hypothetical protein BV25DRAFT_1047936 [Artomyces pyxidatus]|uniref:Uncharacterized protein n=1 Tax=Artomyces pyxidatus TaxID=48021 RepID=A0ACB8SVN7_9AGAM|nr:hypothetical protein BV25DRAFT_1047936 [Artomyces pyxidatus]
MAVPIWCVHYLFLPSPPTFPQKILSAPRRHVTVCNRARCSVSRRWIPSPAYSLPRSPPILRVFVDPHVSQRPLAPLSSPEHASDRTIRPHRSTRGVSSCPPILRSRISCDGAIPRTVLANRAALIDHPTDIVRSRGHTSPNKAAFCVHVRSILAFGGMFLPPSGDIFCHRAIGFGADEVPTVARYVYHPHTIHNLAHQSQSHRHGRISHRMLPL